MDADLLSAGCVEALFDEQPARRPAAERHRHDRGQDAAGKRLFSSVLVCHCFPSQEDGHQGTTKASSRTAAISLCWVQNECAIARALIRKAAVIADKAGAEFPLYATFT